MAIEALLPPAPPDERGEPAKARLLSRRSTIALGLTTTVALIAGAWSVGGRAGFSQIGTGGVNLRLLPKIDQRAPDFVVPTAADGRPVRLSDYRGQAGLAQLLGQLVPALPGGDAGAAGRLRGLIQTFVTPDALTPPLIRRH